jgi:hypothetical protein
VGSYRVATGPLPQAVLTARNPPATPDGTDLTNFKLETLHDWALEEIVSLAIPSIMGQYFQRIS